MKINYFDEWERLQGRRDFFHDMNLIIKRNSDELPILIDDYLSRNTLSKLSLFKLLDIVTNHRTAITSNTLFMRHICIQLTRLMQRDVFSIKSLSKSLAYLLKLPIPLKKKSPLTESISLQFKYILNQYKFDRNRNDYITLLGRMLYILDIIDYDKDEMNVLINAVLSSVNDFYENKEAGIFEEKSEIELSYLFHDLWKIYVYFNLVDGYDLCLKPFAKDITLEQTKFISKQNARKIEFFNIETSLKAYENIYDPFISGLQKRVTKVLKALVKPKIKTEMQVEATLGPFSCDIYIPGANLVIEINGPQHYDSHNKLRIKDQIRVQLIEKRYSVLVLSIPYNDYQIAQKKGGVHEAKYLKSLLGFYPQLFKKTILLKNLLTWSKFQQTLQSNNNDEEKVNKNTFSRI